MTPLGSFAVLASRTEVEAFRAATGLPSGGTVPATFPMRWLAAPEVRAVLLELMPETHLVPVHEAQTFEYFAPLGVDFPYVMELVARRDSAPDRLVVNGTVAGEDRAILVRIETILRLFSTAAVAA